MRDITERFRLSFSDVVAMDPYLRQQLMNQAGDEIERLRKRRDELADMLVRCTWLPGNHRRQRRN